MGEPFAELYAEHLPAARRAAMALVPFDAAEDIVAEAFTRVLARQVVGGGPDGAFRPYLLAAVRNLARDWLAERGRCVPAPIDPRAIRVPGAGELVTAAEETAMTRRAFLSLPARWRAVLWQTEVEGRTPAELAPAAGMTPNGVAQLAWRARLGLAMAWQRERGVQERITGPAPALVRLAKGKHRKTLDTSQADPLSLNCERGPEGQRAGRDSPTSPQARARYGARRLLHNGSRSTAEAGQPPKSQRAVAREPCTQALQLKSGKTSGSGRVPGERVRRNSQGRTGRDANTATDQGNTWPGTSCLSRPSRRTSEPGAPGATRVQPQSTDLWLGPGKEPGRLRHTTRGADGPPLPKRPPWLYLQLHKDEGSRSRRGGIQSACPRPEETPGGGPWGSSPENRGVKSPPRERPSGCLGCLPCPARAFARSSRDGRRGRCRNGTWSTADVTTGCERPLVRLGCICV